jgi:hypothetical protein
MPVEGLALRGVGRGIWCTTFMPAETGVAQARTSLPVDLHHAGVAGLDRPELG